MIQNNFFQSDWEPSPANVLIEFRACVSHFLKHLGDQFSRQQATYNPPPFQASLLAKLLNSDGFQVFWSDKNLSPCIIKRSKYIPHTLSHLSSTTTYLQLSSNYAENKVSATLTLIESFFFIHALAINHPDQTYLWHSLDFPGKLTHFYIMAKLHKSPWAVQPIVSI
jgi:hypothetical protein